MKKFIFVASNGKDTVITHGWGSTREEAKTRLVRSGLHHTWFLVEDIASIKNFIKEIKEGIAECEKQSITRKYLLDQINAQKEDVLALEKYVAENSQDAKLAALQKALELGADIQINFHADAFKAKETDKEEMENKIKAVTEIIGLDYEMKSSERDLSLRWFKAQSRDIDVCAFYHVEGDENVG